MPYNFVAYIFLTKKLCSRLSSSEVQFLNGKRPFCVMRFRTPSYKYMGLELVSFSARLFLQCRFFELTKIKLLN